MIKSVLTLALVAGAGWGLYVWQPWNQGGDATVQSDKGHYSVDRRTIRITLTERGTLKTKKSTPIKAGTHAKIEWVIDEGTVVKKDDVLVRLDKKDAETRYEQLQSQITQIKAELKSAETNEAIQRDQNKTDIEKAERGLEIAKIELTKFTEADVPAELRKLNLAIAEQEVAVQRAFDRLEANRELRKEDFVTPNDVKEAQINHRKAEDALLTARMGLDNYEKYKYPMDKKAKEAGVVEAERGLIRARKKGDAQLQQKIAQLQQKKTSQQRLTFQEKRQKEQLAKMIIKAPSAGTVLYGDPDNPWLAQQIKVGQQVWNSMTLITLPDPSEMAVTLLIHEADIDKIKKGLKCFVTSETQKDRTYEGEVAKIDAVANAGRGGDNIKRFKVEIALSGRDLPLKTGTSARAQILIGEIKDVLSVPLQAVHAESGKYFCFSRDGSRIEVEIGGSNDSHVEVKKGLSEGDQVLLHTPDDKGKAPESDSKDEDAPNGTKTP